MTSQQEVEKQLQQEVKKFSNEIYKGTVETPSNLIDLFKIAILSLSAYAHKINFYKIKAIGSKRISELTVDDISEIVKVILNVPLEKLYSGNTVKLFDLEQQPDDKGEVLDAKEVERLVDLAFSQPFYSSTHTTIPQTVQLSFDEVVENQIQLQKFILAYNQYVDDFHQKLNMKKATLLQLASASKNGTKIIS